MDCSSETEYSGRKLFTLKRSDNTASTSAHNVDHVDGFEDNINLFARECLKTYSTSYLELSDKPDLDEQVAKESASSDSLNNGLNNGQSNGLGDAPDGSTKQQRCLQSLKAPRWFWNGWSHNRGLLLDEAGIYLEGRVAVIFKEQNLNERFVQVKWDDVEEKFYLIIWTGDAGLDYICKVDLGEADPTWHGDHKLSVDAQLTLHKEQRRGFLRDLYTICAELCSYEKSACLASSHNVDRVQQFVHLFQRVAVSIFL